MSNQIKRVMLINPSIELLEDSFRRLTTPLGLLYIGTAMKKNGYDVQLVHSPCEGYDNVRSESPGYVTYGLSDEKIKSRVRDFNPDLVGVGNLFSIQRDSTFHHCDLVKEVADVPVVVGGIHPTLDSQDCINHPSIDFVIMREGEQRILELISGLNSGKREFDFDGIAYKKNGNPVINPATNWLEDINKYGVPDRSLVDMKKYLEIGAFYMPFPHKRKAERVMTSRGCPFQCVFCAYTTGKKVRFRSTDNVIEEIEDLIKKYGIGELHISDDNFTVDRKRALELFRRMEPYNLSWCTPNGVMVQTLDRELIQAAARSGAYQLTFNIESGSQRVLKEIIHKKVPEKEKVKDLVSICHDNDIQVHGQLMIGLPGERREDISATLSYPYEVGFDSVSIFLANPLPGSQLYEICRQKGYLAPVRKAELKKPEIIIPREDPNFVMPGEEMEQIVDRTVRDFKEYSRKKNPEAWKDALDMFERISKERGIRPDVNGRIT